MSVISKIKKSIFGYDIFISYSRKDGLDYAYAIAKYFMGKGYECYIDQLSSIAPGAALPQNIKEAVKRSAAFVLIGSEGTHLSEPIANEIDLFLNNNKNKPLIPITIEGSINSNAIWYGKIFGLALIDDSKEDLRTATPSEDVLNRIENSLTFKKKSKKLRQTSLTILVAGVLLSGYLAFQVRQNIKEAKRTQINLLHSTARDYYIKRDYPNALNQLIEISKINDDKEESFGFFKEGINECISKDSFVNGANYLQTVNELFYKKFPEKFSGIHCRFLFAEARNFLKSYHPIQLDDGDSINIIVGCILNKIHLYPNYIDSVYSFFKNDYYPPISSSTYYTKDSYRDAFEIAINISANDDLISWIGIDSIHIVKLKGNVKYRVPIIKARDLRGAGDIKSFFYLGNISRILVYYTPEYHFDSTFEGSWSWQSQALIYSNGDSIQKIDNPKMINLTTGKEWISSFDESWGYLVDHINYDTVFLKRRDLSLKKTWLYDDLDSVGNSKYMIPSEGKVQSLLVYGKDSFMVIFFNCKSPFIVSNGKYVIDAESQNLWCGDPKAFFSERAWNSALTKEQKRRYGIEFN